MQQIIYDDKIGTVSINDQFDSNLSFALSNQQQTITIIGIENLEKIVALTDTTSNENEHRYLERWWRASVDGGAHYSDWYQVTILKESVKLTGTMSAYTKNTFDLIDFPCLDPETPTTIQLKWVRKGSALSGIILLSEYDLSGNIDRGEVTNATINLAAGDSIIYTPPYVFKVFSLNDIELISTSNDYINIEWRYSQDNKRSWTQWEPLTKENAISARISPIRFFEVEYRFTNATSSSIGIYDFNFIGDFQNVTLDYSKTNLFGIRDNLQSIIASFSTTTNPADNPPVDGGMISTSNNCGPLSDLIKPLTDAQKNQLFKPYALDQATQLLSTLSAQATSIFGFDVIYFVTDADSNGIDHTFHEYQLLNVACDGVIKVSVDQNNFPDNQIVMNQFDLSLFDTFEIHITKQDFKSIFGAQRKPNKDDFLYFPQLSRMFRVEHAQPFRQFNNAAIYYKVMLKKWNQLANMQIEDAGIADKIKNLTNNSTIDELFGLETTNEIKDIANKDLTKTLTKDVIRLKVYAKINKELIENSTLVVSKTNYDLSSVTYNTPAVTYTQADSILEKGDNRAFVLWFNMNNYVVNETYNIVSNYDSANNLGYKVNLMADYFNVTLNSTTYSMHMGTATVSSASALNEETWYCYLANVDQRQRKLTQYVYKRDVDDEEDAPNLGSSKLRLLYKETFDITPETFLLENINTTILGSDMKAANLRIYNDIIAEEVHTKVLNQLIIRDTSSLVMADNMNQTLILPSFDI